MMFPLSFLLGNPGQLSLFKECPPNSLFEISKHSMGRDKSVCVCRREKNEPGIFMHEPTIILLLGTGLVMAASGIRRWRTSRGRAASRD